MGFRLSIRELKQTTAMTATGTSLIRTVVVHVHYKSLYISLPSSAKQQREVIKFCVLWRMRTTAASFFFVFLFGIERWL